MTDMAGKHALRLWGLWSFSLKDTQQRSTHTFSFKKVSRRFLFIYLFHFFLFFFSLLTMCSYRRLLRLPDEPNDLSYIPSGKPCLGSSLLVHCTPYKGVSKVKCLRRTNRRADPFTERPGARARLLQKSIGCPQESSRPPT